MAKVFPEIDQKIRDWISAQKMFFVSTAPLSADGLVNCSPKGTDSFRVLGPTTIAYLDYTGSGVETIAHLRENQRITIMMCAFEGPPKIFRFHGKGEAFETGSPRYNELVPHFEEGSGARAIIHIELDRISDSCGYSIPLYDYVSDRQALTKWADTKGPEGIQDYQQQNNRHSLDGLPAIKPAE